MFLNQSLLYKLFKEVKMFGDKRDKNRKFFHHNFFPKNRKGLSTIVVTLIIILISLVAVGIVWVMVRGLINTGTQGVGVSSKCLNINVEATAVNCSNLGASRICDVQLMRSGTGSDAIDGVKLIFKNSTNGVSSSLISISGNIEPLVGKKQTGINTTILNTVGVNEVDVTAFFKDTSGNDQICSQTTPYSNSAGF